MLVITPSIIPSGTSEPSGHKIAGFVIKCPTFLTNIKLRPLRESSEPLGEQYCLSGFIFLTKLPVPLSTFSSKSPLFSPSQFLYARALSDASTAATESSQSMMVLKADSRMISLTLALSEAPILLSELT